MDHEEAFFPAGGRARIGPSFAVQCARRLTHRVAGAQSGYTLKGGNSFEAMQAYAKSQGYGWYYALDDKSVLADAFGASRTPECFLFDKNGTLVYHGAIDDSPGDPNRVQRPHLRMALDEMLAGKEVSVKETRSVGCSISRAS